MGYDARLDSSARHLGREDTCPSVAWAGGVVDCNGALGLYGCMFDTCADSGMAHGDSSESELDT